ncbi:MAG: hypothetical protein AB7L65_02325 [Hyphomonadaceae bacterium]
MSVTRNGAPVRLVAQMRPQAPRVLLIGPVSHVREGLAAALRAAGMSPVLADDMLGAAVAVARAPAALAIVTAEVSHAAQFIARLRASPAFLDTPIIALSTSPAQAASARAAGADAAHEGPLTARDVAALAKAALR